MILSDFRVERETFLKGEPLVKEFSSFSEENCPELEALLATLLRSISLEFLLEIVFTVLNELLINAFKANAKRVFFENKGIDINNKLEYERLLKDFRDEFGEFRSELIQNLEKSQYRIALKLSLDDEKIRFWVTNNAKILDEEMNRIDFRLFSSSKVRNLTDAYHEALDMEESSGLGIVLIQLLLRNSGIIENRFTVVSEGVETSAYFEIPRTILPKETKQKIRSLIEEGVEGLPPFPKKVSEVLNLIQTPSYSMASVAKLIETDPAMTIEVLKLSNSPLYSVSLKGKITNILEAIQRIGIKNLQLILYATGAKRAFPMHYQRVREIWSHALRTAFYAVDLSARRKDKIRKDLVSVGALLHDLGRMVLATMDRSLVDLMNQFRRDKLMNNSDFIEEISLGTSHSEIGSILSQKWNFPTELCELIVHHHRPWLSSESLQSECETIYVADFLANFSRKKINHATMDPHILVKFGFSSPEDMIDYERKIRERAQALEELEEDGQD
jgi:HD-like signal output (HDOD) protein